MPTRLAKCLACGSKELKPVLNLGMQPLANNYGETRKYPLGINGCVICGHAQLTDSVPPKTLFSHYLYESGTSDTLLKWFKRFARRLGKPRKLLDIASNDGTFIGVCHDMGWKVLGIDPAHNLVPPGLPTICDFFTEFSRLGEFDVITAFNVVAHNPDPLGMLKGIKANLKKNGRAYVMTSQGNMFETGQFDTIYHEHHSFFTPESMTILARRAGLDVVSVRTEPIHGGSLLFELAHTQGDQFTRFAEKAAKVIKEAQSFKPKYRLVAVGAAAKGVVFLNATGMKPEVVFDEAELKWGHDIPGTDIPIRDLDCIADYNEPLTIIILAWNFYEELSKKIKELRPGQRDQIISFFGDDE